jgi:hypothetical protein
MLCNDQSLNFLYGYNSDQLSITCFGFCNEFRPPLMPFNGFLRFRFPLWPTNLSDTFTTQKFQCTLKRDLLRVHILSSDILKILSILQGKSPNSPNMLTNAHGLIWSYRSLRCKHLIYCSNTRNWKIIADVLYINVSLVSEMKKNVKYYDDSMYLWQCSKRSPMFDVISNFRMCYKYRMIIIRMFSL